jgi:predicted transcriptional regulator
MSENKKNRKKINSKFSSTIEKGENKIVPRNEKIQQNTKSLSSIKKLKKTSLKGPNALTMIQSLTNNDKVLKRNRKKLGDGSFIEAEDR